MWIYFKNKIIESIFRKWTLRWETLRENNFHFVFIFEKIALQKLIVQFLNKLFKIQNFFISDKIVDHFPDNIYI